MVILSIWFPITTLFFLGLTIGSFINALEYRIKHKKDILTARSRCPHCKHILAPLDLVPILSFLLLKGKCRYCKKKISIQYPLVELATGFLFAYTGWFYKDLFTNILDSSSYLFALLFVFCIATILSSFIFFAVYDVKFMIVPNGLVYLLIGLFFSINLVIFILSQFSVSLPYPELLPASSGSRFIAGVFGFVLFYILILITRYKGMGAGDLKLAVFEGLLLGVHSFISALYISFITGAIVGIAYALKTKRFKGEKIPFAPFLCLGGLIAYFYGEQIFRFLFPGVEELIKLI